MALTTAEVDALRFHLGYGNVAVGAYPYTPDGFFEIFSTVIAPNLSTGTETSATTAIVSGATVAITPVSMTGILPYGRLLIDAGDDAETVVVKVVTGTTFVAAFINAHSALGYPICTESGVSRLRGLLHSATKAWEALQSSKITKTAGLNSVGKGEVVWFAGGQVLKQTLDQYRQIAQSIGDLVRVQPRWSTDGSDGPLSQLEAY